VGQARIFVACLDVCEALGMVRLDHMGIVHVAP
jgi:hypothetical protein